ncbi:MAG: Helix-turn-helix domain, partial [Anaerospora sp.]|nr:Helix-turn-helix domain [Anaerospora sp.]
MALDYKQTGKRLKLVRGRLTQEAFANSLGVSASYVKKTELGGKPSLKYLANIAAGYGVSLDWLLLSDE